MTANPAVIECFSFVLHFRCPSPFDPMDPNLIQDPCSIFSSRVAGTTPREVPFGTSFFTFGSNHSPITGTQAGAAKSFKQVVLSTYETRPLPQTTDRLPTIEQKLPNLKRLQREGSLSHLGEVFFVQSAGYEGFNRVLPLVVVPSRRQRGNG